MKQSAFAIRFMALTTILYVQDVHFGVIADANNRFFSVGMSYAIR